MRGLDGSGVFSVDAHAGGGGDGVLVGGEEEELPVVFLLLVSDHAEDLRDVVVGGGVFEAVGEDGDDDLSGPGGFRDGFQALAEIDDGAADGVEEGGGPARDVGRGVEVDHLRDGQAFAGDEVFVIEEDESEAGLPRRLALLAKELVEAGDGGLDQGAYGAGAVEDVGDFGEVLVHRGQS